MREGGVAAPPSATRTSIRPLPPAAREVAGSTDGITRAEGGSVAGRLDRLFNFLALFAKDFHK
jgi:hypothetical protein